MAIFSPGPAVGGISGNAGGLNFVNAPGSKVIRMRKRPTPNGTVEQKKQQVILRNAQNRWANLSDELRQSWRASASTILFPNRLGQQRSLSGYQYFLKINLLAIKDEPPVQLTQTVFPAVEFSSTVSAGIDISPIDPDVTENYIGAVYGRNLMRNTPLKSTNTHRFITYAIFIGGAGNNITVDWEAAIGLPILGQYVAIQFRPFVGTYPIGGYTTDIIETKA